MVAARLTRVGRLGPLLLAGVVVWLGWLGTWLLSYRLTQGNDFTYTFLTTYDGVWWKLYDLLTLANTLLPGLEPPQDIHILVVALVASFGVASVGYLAGVILLDSGASAVAGALPIVWLVTLGAHAILLLMPGTYTTDIFSYVLYGNIAGLYGANPYVAPPNAFPDDPILSWINPIWHAVPSVYGPLWTAMSVPLARATEPLGLMEHVLTYRALLNVAQLVNDALVWFLLGRLLRGRGQPARLGAFVLFAWNPVMLFEVAGNAHNDGLMVTWLLLGLVPLALAASDRTASPRDVAHNSRWAASLVLLALGALVKYTTAIVGLFAGVVWLRRLRTPRARVVWLGVTALGVLGLTALLFWPWLDGPAALAPIIQAAGGRYHMNSLTDLATLSFADRWLDPAGLDRDLAETTARTWAKAATWTAFAVYVGWEAWRLWRVAGRADSDADGSAIRDLVLDVLGASVRAFLVLLLFVFTWVWAWYFTWPLALASLRGWRDTLARVAVGYTLTSLPIFYIHHYLTSEMPDAFLFLYAVPPLLVPLWTHSPLAKRANHLDQVVGVAQRA